MKVIDDDDDDDFFSSTLIDAIALMLPCCQKLLPWISVTGPRHSGSRLYVDSVIHFANQTIANFLDQRVNAKRRFDFGNCIQL